jgi:hypothetical protein
VPRPDPAARAEEPPPDQVGPPPGAGTAPQRAHGGDLGEPSPDQQAAMAEQLAELRRELLATPPEIVVANHAYGLFELAAIHLSQRPPALEHARLAIDAMAAVVEGLSGRLGDVEASLKDALAQVRMAFIQISNADAQDGDARDQGHGAGAPS